jgi:hypothetical protein
VTLHKSARPPSSGWDTSGRSQVERPLSRANSPSSQELCGPVNNPLERMFCSRVLSRVAVPKRVPGCCAGCWGHSLITTQGGKSCSKLPETPLFCPRSGLAASQQGSSLHWILLIRSAVSSESGLRGHPHWTPAPCHRVASKQPLLHLGQHLAHSKCSVNAA